MPKENISEFHRNLPVKKKPPGTTSKTDTVAPIKSFKTSHGKKWNFA